MFPLSTHLTLLRWQRSCWKVYLEHLTYLVRFDCKLLKAVDDHFNQRNVLGSAENEYVMRCITRTFSCLQEQVMPFLATCLPVMTQKLAMAAKNPTKPHFNHYLFEALALSIRIVCKGQPTAVSNFETVLFPVFQQILVEDVQEFQPYVFQILSLLLEFQTSGTIPQPYMELFAFLLMPVLWERPGNIKPLVRLIQACIKVGPAQIVGLNKIESLLGVFQKLIASKGSNLLSLKGLNHRHFK